MAAWALQVATIAPTVNKTTPKSLPNAQISLQLLLFLAGQVESVDHFEEVLVEVHVGLAV